MQTTNNVSEVSQVATDKSDLGNLSVRDLFFKYIRFLPLFVLSLALALFGAYIYLRYATPIFNAVGTIRIKNDKTTGSKGDEKLNQLVLNEGTQNIQNEIEMLKSRPMMLRVVDNLNLQVNYYAVGKIKSPNIYKQGPFLLDVLKLSDSLRVFSLNIKFSDSNSFTVSGNKNSLSYDQPFTNESGTFKLIKNNYGSPGKEYNVTWQPAYEVASSYADKIQVAPKPGTEILTISLETTNPSLSADIINVLMLKYGDWTREDKKQQANQTLNFIQIRLDKLQEEKDSIQRVILDKKIKYNLIAPDVQTQVYFENVKEADKAINEQNLQSGIADMIDEYLRNKKNEFSTVPVPSSLGLNDATLNSLVVQFNTLQLKRKSYIDAGIPVNNPYVAESDQLIESLRTKILESVKNIKGSLNLMRESFKKRSGTAETEIKILPEKQKELAEIQTLLDSKLDLYKYLITKKEETAISLASTTSNSLIIDEAVASYTPVKPNKRAIQLIAIVIGLGLPALFIFLIEIMNDKITTRYDIEKITQTPIIGEIGHSFADNAMVVSKTNRGMVAEQFRIVRSNLQYVLNKIEKPVILVTSSFSGEGKSFVSTNLGAVMALAGRKTIVLEFDIRKPKIVKGLGLSKRTGITNFLLGKATLEELPVLVPGYENLYVLSCGPVPPNPAELLLDAKVEELFTKLKEEYDVILIDTAPVGMVSDALTLSKFANCTLYIVRQGHTFKKQIALIDEFYMESKLPRTSIIINDVKVKPGYGYYGYGRYGYGYGYTSGYYEEENSRHGFVERLFRRFTLKKSRQSSKSDQS